MNQPNGSPARQSLRRSRSERILFGVCGGIADFFNLDPTVVRVGFVLLSLVPPVGGTLLLGYIAMTLIVPEEGAEQLPGRDQVKENFTSLRTEVTTLAETVRAKVTGEPSVKEEPTLGAVDLPEAPVSGAPAASGSTERTERAPAGVR
jgi:phage shock protein PspC (stress-responsive transcriptional regulator)